MKLTSVLLCGFRSYPDSTPLEIDQRYQCMVGPNGCGKSAIFESIRWVLLDPALDLPPIQILFKGTDKRRPTRGALVTLTFELENGQPLTLSRFLDRPGQHPDYRVNDQSVSLDSVPPEVSAVAAQTRVVETPDQLCALAESDEQDLILLIDNAEIHLTEEHQFRPYRKALQRLALNRHQVILSTHRKEIMADADSLVGVTMEEYGVSKPIGMRLLERRKNNQDPSRRCP